MSSPVVQSAKNVPAKNAATATRMLDGEMHLVYCCDLMTIDFSHRHLIALILTFSFVSHAHFVELLLKIKPGIEESQAENVLRSTSTYLYKYKYNI